MKDFDPLREFLFDYITVVCENTLSIAVIGSIFAGDMQISFVYFFLPFALALLCMIPCIPIYLKEDMSVKAILFQRVVEFIVLEIVITAAIRFVFKDTLPKAAYAAILVSVAFFDVLSYLIKWYLEKNEAQKINRKLQEHRENSQKLKDRADKE